jgi:hypothetical protein
MCHGKKFWLAFLAISFLFSLPLSADNAPPDPLTVDRTPPTVTRRTYDPDHPDPRMPATHSDEAGVTVSEYGCVAEVNGQITDAPATQPDATVAVRVDSIHIVLKLDVTEWMSQVAPQKIWFHEDGHRKIALHFYAHADEVAAAIARGWMGKSLTASGTDTKAAAKEAITEIAQKITAAYMTQVRDQSELVQEAYDRITAHGTNSVDESDAIRQALAEVAKGETTRPSAN